MLQREKEKERDVSSGKVMGRRERGDRGLRADPIAPSGRAHPHRPLPLSHPPARAKATTCTVCTRLLDIPTPSQPGPDTVRRRHTCLSPSAHSSLSRPLTATTPH